MKFGWRTVWALSLRPCGIQPFLKQQQSLKSAINLKQGIFADWRSSWLSPLLHFLSFFFFFLNQKAISVLWEHWWFFISEYAHTFWLSFQYFCNIKFWCFMDFIFACLVFLHTPKSRLRSVCVWESIEVFYVTFWRKPRGRLRRELCFGTNPISLNFVWPCS